MANNDLLFFFGTIISGLLTTVCFFLRATLVELKGKLKEHDQRLGIHDTEIAVIKSELQNV